MSNHLSVLRLIFLFLLTIQSAFGQKIDQQLKLKFGDIKPADFDLSKNVFDTSAEAVVIADIGESSFKENNKEWFSLIFERHQRIKVLNKNGLDAANFVIQQYKDASNEEKILKLKASTYNLENGKVVETKLAANSIFKDQLDKTHSVTKFGLPNVKEGSIIEVYYVLESDFLFNLQSWNFQGIYPNLWSEYTVHLPDFFNYVGLSSGYLPYTSKTSKDDFKTYRVVIKNDVGRSDIAELRTEESVTRWLIKDVPALKLEPFTTTLRNHISKLKFQLSQYRFPNQPVRDIMNTWQEVAKRLKEDEEFAAPLQKENGWLKDDVRAIIQGATTDQEKAMKIYFFIRDKFTTLEDGGIYLSTKLQNVFKAKKGYAAEINLLLAAMLKVADLEVDPVLVSTRAHGANNPTYPILSQYDHVICKVKMGEDSTLLDASEPMLGFGKLPLSCYNGYARVIADYPAIVKLDASDVKEQKTTIINFFNADKPFQATLFSKPGTYESMSIRKSIQQMGLTAWTRTIKNALPADVEMDTVQVGNLGDYEQAVTIKYNMDFSQMKDADILYITPLLGEIYKENPFKSAERLYPVEMPYAFKETMIVNFAIPPGFVVDEIPKSARFKLEEGAGSFDYMIQQTEEIIQLRCVVNLAVANFTPDAYSVLREFYTQIVKKQAEQIVLKKK